jgi:hypothetical protein
LLAACVALVAHPDDDRYKPLFGSMVTTPVFGVEVPIVAHHLAQPDKGSGIAMICTFGDVTEVIWWRELDLPNRAILGFDGRILSDAPDVITSGAGKAAFAEIAGKMQMRFLSEKARAEKAEAELDAAKSSAVVLLARVGQAEAHALHLLGQESQRATLQLETSKERDVALDECARLRAELEAMIRGAAKLGDSYSEAKAHLGDALISNAQLRAELDRARARGKALCDDVYQLRAELERVRSERQWPTPEDRQG